jgi:hypothetical protein
MSSDFLLERTRQADLQPLVANGVPVFRIYGQIRVELLNSLSQEHLDLFADPNPDPATGDIQWYSPISGEKLRLVDCPEDVRSEVEFHLARLVDDIVAHAQKLADLPAPASRAMAHVLSMALEVPDEGHIFVVGGRPVLAGWGHVPRGPAAPLRILTTLARRVISLDSAAATPPAETAVPAAEARAQPEAVSALSTEPNQPSGPPFVPVSTERLRHYAVIPLDAPRVQPVGRFAWLSPIIWTIFTLLLLTAGHLLLRYCGLGWPVSEVTASNSIVNYCEAPPTRVAPALSPDPRNGVLLAELRQLEQALEAKRRQCVAEAPRPPQPPPQRPKSADLVERERGTIGAVNVILTWNTQDDLDLHVTCPTGEHIYFSDKQKCGGTLDVDKNAGESSIALQPVENVTWPSVVAAPRGSYKVEVELFTTRGSRSGPIEFTVELLIGGEKKEEHKQRIQGEKTKNHVFNFALPYAGRRP